MNVTRWVPVLGGGAPPLLVVRKERRAQRIQGAGSAGAGSRGWGAPGGFLVYPAGKEKKARGCNGWDVLAALRVLPLLSDGWWVAEVRR